MFTPRLRDAGADAVAPACACPLRSLLVSRVRSYGHPVARCGRLGGQYLAGVGLKQHVHILRAGPFSPHDEQRLAGLAPEHAREASQVGIDALQHLSALADAHATLVGDGAVPDGPFRVHADPIGGIVAEVGPHPPVRKAAVRGDVEGAQAPRPGLGDDQGRVIGRDNHAVTEHDVLGYLPDRAIRMDQHDDPGLRPLAGLEVEVATVDVGVTAAVDHDLVEPVGDTTKVGVGHERPFGFNAQEKRLGSRNDEHAPVG